VFGGLVIQDRETLTFVIPTEHFDPLCESKAQWRNLLFLPSLTGLDRLAIPTRGLRPGLHCYAASRLPYLSFQPLRVFLTAEG